MLFIPWRKTVGEIHLHVLNSPSQMGAFQKELVYVVKAFINKRKNKGRVEYLSGGRVMVSQLILGNLGSS